MNRRFISITFGVLMALIFAIGTAVGGFWNGTRVSKLEVQVGTMSAALTQGPPLTATLVRPTRKPTLPPTSTPTNTPTPAETATNTPGPSPTPTLITAVVVQNDCTVTKQLGFNVKVIMPGVVIVIEADLDPGEGEDYWDAPQTWVQPTFSYQGIRPGHYTVTVYVGPRPDTEQPTFVLPSNAQVLGREEFTVSKCPSRTATPTRTPTPAVTLTP